MILKSHVFASLVGLSLVSASSVCCNDESKAADRVGARENLRLRTLARTPLLDGPDALEKAPVVVITPERVDLDDRPMGPGELERELAALKKTYEMLRPGTVFNGQIIVACSPDTGTDRLSGHLRGALAAGYAKVLFAFLRRVPGTDWSTGTAAIASIESSGKKSRSPNVVVTLNRYRDCLSLGQTLVEHRRRRETIQMELQATKAVQQGDEAAGIRPPLAATTFDRQEETHAIQGTTHCRSEHLDRVRHGPR